MRERIRDVLPGEARAWGNSISVLHHLLDYCERESKLSPKASTSQSLKLRESSLSSGSGETVTLGAVPQKNMLSDVTFRISGVL